MGRELELEQLTLWFSEPNAVSITVVGRFGSGRRALVRRAAEAWARVHERRSFEEATPLDPNGRRLALRSEHGFDIEVVTALRPRRIAAERVLNLQPLSHDESLELFLELASLFSPTADCPRDDARRLMEQLGGNPAAIEMAAAWLDVVSLSDLSARWTTLLSSKRPTLPAMSSHWRSFDELAAPAMNQLSQEDLEFVRQVALLPQPVDLATLERSILVNDDVTSLCRRAMDAGTLERVEESGSVLFRVPPPFGNLLGLPDASTAVLDRFLTSVEGQHARPSGRFLRSRLNLLSLTELRRLRARALSGLLAPDSPRPSFSEQQWFGFVPGMHEVDGREVEPARSADPSLRTIESIEASLGNAARSERTADVSTCRTHLAKSVDHTIPLLQMLRAWIWARALFNTDRTTEAIESFVEAEQTARTLISEADYLIIYVDRLLLEASIRGNWRAIIRKTRSLIEVSHGPTRAYLSMRLASLLLAHGRFREARRWISAALSLLPVGPARDEAELQFAACALANAEPTLWEASHRQHLARASASPCINATWRALEAITREDQVELAQVPRHWHPALERLVDRLAGTRRRRRLNSALATTPALTLRADGTCLVGSAEVDLSRRQKLRQVLELLIEAHLAKGVVKDAAIIAALWPDHRERNVRTMKNRLHATVSQLRTLAVGRYLERTDEGYRLSAQLQVHVELASARD